MQHFVNMWHFHQHKIRWICDVEDELTHPVNIYFLQRENMHLYLLALDVNHLIQYGGLVSGQFGMPRFSILHETLLGPVSI